LLFNKIMVLILAIYTLALIYSAIRNKIKLGKIEMRIKPKHMNFTVIMYIFFGFYWILNGFSDYKGYLEDSLSDIIMIAISILGIINQYKLGQVRVGGINTPLRIYRWDELEGYYHYYYKNEIIICTNKESLFFKKKKEIKWRVKECQVEDIENILEKNIDLT